jgi:molybdopterin molybdotransferase
MRGFAQRTTVEAAIAWIDAALPTFAALPTEPVSLPDAAGRILAADIVSPVDIPGFARSMMDGFAVRGEDTYGATPYNALPLRIVGTCLPGDPYSGTLGPGEAIRIMTGAPLPAGADAVLPVEQTELAGRQLLARGEVSTGKHVAQIGEDIRAGEILLPAGRKLRPQDLGVLSSIGLREVAAIRAPRVRVLITGNELLPAGTRPSGYRVADANGPMLRALVARDGGELAGCDQIPDDPAAIRAALLSPAEVVLVSGGSSVGLEDHAPRLLAEEGELAIHGIAMRPSSPAGMGRIAGRLVFLLPGNPVSCLCAYDFFAGRAIRGLAGKPTGWPYRQISGTLARKLVSTVGRVDYARVLVRGQEIEPLAISGASILSSTTRADGFVIVPADSEGSPPGAVVNAFLYD